VVFSDGTPLTADHVVRSLRAVEGLANHAAVTAEGQRVVFALERPHPRFSLLLSNHFCSVVLESDGRLLGTGAFFMQADPSPGEVRLQRNPRYRHPVALDELHFLHCPPTGGDDAGGLMDALASGEVHFAVDLSRDDLMRLDQLCKWFRPGVSTASLYFNTQSGVLRDARVRRALSLAIDREGLARICYQNAVGFTASSLLPPIMGGDFRDGIPHDPGLARALLHDAGVDLPLKLKLLLPWGPRLYLPHPRRVAEAIQGQLAAIGVEISVVPSLDIVDFYERTCDVDYELGLIGWVPNSLDPGDFLEVSLASRSIPERGKSQAVRSNFARWDDAEADWLLAHYLEHGDEATKLAILRRVAREAPLLPLIYGPSLAVHTPRLHGFTPMPIAYHNRFCGVDLLEERSLQRTAPARGQP
jgi:ABC-type transport system substrate-binding protein